MLSTTLFFITFVLRKHTTHRGYLYEKIHFILISDAILSA